MDIIDRNMKSIPDEVRYSLEILYMGSEEEIAHVLPTQLNEIKRISQVSRDHANETVAAFTVVKNILEELIAGGKTKELVSESEVGTIDIQLQANSRKRNGRAKKKTRREKKGNQGKIGEC